MRKVLFFSFFMLFGGISALPAQAASHLVISEIRVAGDLFYDEYVKIYNPTDSDINIEGYKLTKKTASGNEYNLLTSFPASIVKSKESIIISHQQATYEGLKYSTKSYSLASDNTVLIYDKSKAVVDKVGFGPVTDYEKNPAAALGKNQKLIRKDNIDTDDNAADFEVISDGEDPAPVENPGNSSSQSANIVISELYPDPPTEISESKGEWIELFNSESFDVDLGGWALEDVRGSVHKFIIQGGTIIPKSGFLAFESAVTKISLNNDGDEVLLIDKNGSIIYSAPDFGKTKTGLSFANFDNIWSWTQTVTKGGANIKDIIEEEASFSASTSKAKTTTKKAATTKKSTSSTSKATTGKAKTVGTVEDPEVLGMGDIASEEKDLNNNGNLGIMFGLGGAVIASLYLAYKNKDSLSENFKN